MKILSKFFGFTASLCFGLVLSSLVAMQPSAETPVVPVSEPSSVTTIAPASPLITPGTEVQGEEAVEEEAAAPEKGGKKRRGRKQRRGQKRGQQKRGGQQRAGRAAGRAGSMQQPLRIRGTMGAQLPQGLSAQELNMQRQGMLYQQQLQRRMELLRARNAQLGQAPSQQMHQPNQQVGQSARLGGMQQHGGQKRRGMKKHRGQKGRRHRQRNTQQDAQTENNAAEVVEESNETTEVTTTANQTAETSVKSE